LETNQINNHVIMKNSSKYLFLISIFFLLLTNNTHGQDKLISFKNEKGNLIGFKSTTGKVIVEPQYDWIGYTFVNGHILVSIEDKVGVMNVNGEIVVPLLYNSIDIHAFANDSVISVTQNEKYGYIDKVGNILIPIKYDDLGNYHNGQYKVMVNGKWGIINLKGEILLPIRYTDIVQPFCNGFATVQIGYRRDSTNDNYWDITNYKYTKFGYVDKLNNEVLFDTDLRTYNLGNYSIQNELFKNDDLFKINHTTKLKKELADSLFSYALAKFKTGFLYADFCKLNKKCVADGLLMNGDILGETSFFHSKIESEYFTKNTIHKIIATAYLREMTWTWISPIYKKIFQSSNSIIQKTYKDIAIYLKNYINNYNKEKVEEYLKRDERKFARLDINGNFDPNRKLSAFIDRLIIIHKVINVEDAKFWVNKISDEVLSW